MLTKSRISELISCCYNGIKQTQFTTVVGTLAVPSVLMFAIPAHAAPPQLEVTTGTKEDPTSITEKKSKIIQHQSQSTLQA